MTIKSFIIRNKWVIAGIAAGGLLGYLYYAFIGCASGTCAITSRPINSTLYGMLMGGLFLNLFTGNKEPKNNAN